MQQFVRIRTLFVQFLNAVRTPVRAPCVDTLPVPYPLYPYPYPTRMPPPGWPGVACAIYTHIIVHSYSRP